MIRFFKEALTALFSIGLLIVGCFFLLRYSPGSIFDLERRLDPVVRSGLESQFSLNGSVLNQLSVFVQRLFTFDWGNSILYPDKSVSQIIWQAYQAGFNLYFGSCIFFFVFIFVFGFIMLRFLNENQIGRFQDLITQIVSLPTLFIVPALIWVFGIHWGIIDLVVNEQFSSWVLPIFCLTLRPAGFALKVFISHFRESLNTEYVVLAKAKGLSQHQIYFKHILKNCIPSMIAVLPSLMLNVISGSLVIESMFSIQGIGSLMVDAMMGRDDFVVVVLICISGILSVILTQSSELCLRYLDPRLLQKGGA